MVMGEKNLKSMMGEKFSNRSEKEKKI